MAVDGFFLGGVNKGLNAFDDAALRRENSLANRDIAQRGLGLREQAFDMKKRMLQDARSQRDMAEANAAIQTNMKFMEKTIGLVKAAGGTREKAESTIKSHIDALIETSKNHGIDPTPFLNQIETMIGLPGAQSELITIPKHGFARRNPQTGELERVDLGGGPDLGTLTKGQEALDKTFAKDASGFLSGGFADPSKNLSQLNIVIDRLGRSDNLTGPVIGMMPESVRTIANPKSIDTQELLEEVVQRNLRLILGAQFTEKEGVRLIRRAFNPLLEEKDNLARVKRLMESMRSALAAKMKAVQYFQQHGTLKGFQGVLPGPGDVGNATFGPDGTGDISSESKQKLKFNPATGNFE